MRDLFWYGVATTGWALLHSLLASLWMKARVAELAGRRAEQGLYRLFFVVQALLSWGLLIAYERRLPTRILYEFRAPVAWLIRAGQMLGVLHALFSGRSVGLSYLTGWHNFRAWMKKGSIPPAPIAQGPEQTPDGEFRVAGPFLGSRHPLNFAGIPIFWLTPRMTTHRLVFNLIISLYLVLGSFHEERRLRAVHGARYEAYQRSGTSFFLPRLLKRQKPTGKAARDNSA
jgi:methanethiol S-methyltransferase